MAESKVLFVTTHFEPDYHYGGVVESGSKLLKYLRKETSNITLIFVTKNPNNALNYIQAKDIVCKSFIFHDWGFSISLIWKLFLAVKKADKIYINGIVTFPNTLAQFYSAILGKPFINSIRGGLEEWRVNHKGWKKKPFMHFITLPLLRKAKNIHVTAQSEQASLQNFGFNKSFISTNGIDIETFNSLPSKREFLDNVGKKKFLFLFLSRTDKEKGIDLLLKAYDLFCEKYNINDHQLMIVGPDNQEYLKSLNINYALKNIIYVDGIYNYEKILLLRKANVFVLPSYSENFGNVIAEALACELPVITTTGTPWSEIEQIGCGTYIEPVFQQLFIAMERIYLSSESQRVEMGKKGRSYILNNFSWQIKAAEIQEKIDEL